MREYVVEFINEERQYIIEEQVKANNKEEAIKLVTKSIKARHDKEEFNQIKLLSVATKKAHEKWVDEINGR